MLSVTFLAGPELGQGDSAAILGGALRVMVVEISGTVLAEEEKLFVPLTEENWPHYLLLGRAQTLPAFCLKVHTKGRNSSAAF